MADYLLKFGDFEELLDIAYMLNYSNQSHFIQQINKLCGIRPKKLQSRHELPEVIALIAKLQTQL